MSGDWYKLDEKQYGDVQALRERICQSMIGEIEAFYKVHPEIQVTWSVTLDGFKRDSQVSLQKYLVEKERR